ncbi:MAG TPA: sulfite exporter TauE/SafE family protein [Verrucomicrobiae bacterium]|nr:sulfite exporter TauE/SafE family protein [Verrucomicrobiae bacterium]
MPSLRTLLFAALAATTVWFIWAWLRLSKSRPTVVAGERSHTWYHTVVGFVMCFFDTLGIGNFATTTSAFKFRSSIPDEKIPGTLNVGYAIPTVLQALIYISIVEVDVVTLTLMIAASVVGAWLGAGIVSRWPRSAVQVGMGCALLAAAGLMLRAQLVAGGPTEGTLALSGNLLALGLLGNFALGALMTMGIGLYGPCLILVSLLGMSPSAAFPIMMGSCAFLMPIGGIRFVREGSYAPWTSVVLSLAGLPSVLIAAFIVRSLPLTAVRWLVIVVVVYAAVMMLRSARAGRVAVPA